LYGLSTISKTQVSVKAKNADFPAPSMEQSFYYA